MFPGSDVFIWILVYFFVVVVATVVFQSLDTM